MVGSIWLALSPYHFRVKAPCALGKAGIPAGRDFYLMPDYAHPASPTAIGLLKNLTEKTGTHTLFYDQKKQNKTTANNRHSFCRFCACAIWWYPNSFKEWSNMLTQCGEQLYLRATWITKTRAVVHHSPLQHGRSTLWGFHLPPLLQTEPNTCGVGTAGTATAQPPRHSAAFGNSLCFYVCCLL